jgi:hypothetical protein
MEVTQILLNYCICVTRRNKAQQAFNQLGGMWKTNVVSADTKSKCVTVQLKIRILLYDAETWKVDQDMTKKLQTITNKARTNRNHSKTRKWN